MAFKVDTSVSKLRRIRDDELMVSYKAPRDAEMCKKISKLAASAKVSRTDVVRQMILHCLGGK